MSSSIAQKFKNIGPGALVAAGFIGPGTVTTCTVSGASYGYTMLWALLFATVATIIFQEMASRVGIVSGKGLGENIRDRIPNKTLMWIAIVIVIIAIFVGNIAYETGNITGGILGIQAVTPDIPMIPIVVVLGLLAFAAMWIGSYKVVEVILTGIVVFMGVVFLVEPRLGRHRARPVRAGAARRGIEGHPDRGGPHRHHHRAVQPVPACLRCVRALQGPRAGVRRPLRHHPEHRPGRHHLHGHPRVRRRARGQRG